MHDDNDGSSLTHLYKHTYLHVILATEAWQCYIINLQNHHNSFYESLKKMDKRNQLERFSDYSQ